MGTLEKGPSALFIKVLTKELLEPRLDADVPCTKSVMDTFIEVIKREVSK